MCSLTQDTPLQPSAYSTFPTKHDRNGQSIVIVAVDHPLLSVFFVLRTIRKQYTVRIGRIATHTLRNLRQ